MAASTAISIRSATALLPSWRVWDLVIAITLRDLRVKYHGTYFSYFWWVARPLTTGLVLYFALSYVLDVDIEHHAIFLLSALFPWFWFQNGLSSATGAFIGNAGLLKKVRFPRGILPVSLVVASTFEFLVSLPILIALVLFNGLDPSWTWLLGIPVLVGLQFLLLAGLGVTLACLNVFVRDLAPGVSAALGVLFYASPIMYPLDRVPEDVRWVLMLNPIVPILDAWRGLFIEGDLPGVALWPSLLLTAVALTAGLLVMRAVGRSLADAL